MRDELRFYWLCEEYIIFTDGGVLEGILLPDGSFSPNIPVHLAYNPRFQRLFGRAAVATEAPEEPLRCDGSPGECQCSQHQPWD